MVERRERRLRRGVERPAASTASAPCAGAGRTVAGIQRLGHRVQQAQPRQPRHRQDDGVEVARVVVPRTLVARHPAEPGRHVPAQVHDLQVGTGREQLGGAPRRPGAHPRARRQRRQGEAVACAQRVARVGPLGDGDQAQALGRCGGQVLHRVHGQVALPGQQGLAQRGDEDAGPAERRERPGEPVAVGADPDQLDRVARPRPERVAERVGDHAGLGDGELAAPRADPHAVPALTLCPPSRCARPHAVPVLTPLARTRTPRARARDARPAGSRSSRPGTRRTTGRAGSARAAPSAPRPRPRAALAWLV